MSRQSGKTRQSGLERAGPPQREPESQQDVDDITRGDPFQNMTEEELAAWRRAEDRFLGM